MRDNPQAALRFYYEFLLAHSGARSTLLTDSKANGVEQSVYRDEFIYRESECRPSCPVKSAAEQKIIHKSFIQISA